MSKYRVAIPPALKLFLKDNPFFRRSCVYKFHHSQHCKSIFENGTIKIGRSSDYRSIKKETLKDAYEGVEWTGFHDHKATKLSDLDRRSGVHRVLSGAGSLQALSVMVVNADLYIYCFSCENSKKVLESFRDEEPYDSVAVCADIFSVAEIVCEHHPLLRGSRYLCLPVVYRERLHLADEPYASPEELAFEKPLKFVTNLEGRIVFIPPSTLHERPQLSLWSHPDLAKLFRPALLV